MFLDCSMRVTLGSPLLLMLNLKHFLLHKIGFSLSFPSHRIILFSLQVSECNWPSRQAPSLHNLFAVCKNMHNWLKQNPKNVCVITCSVRERGEKNTTCNCTVIFILISMPVHFLLLIRRIFVSQPFSAKTYFRHCLLKLCFSLFMWYIFILFFIVFYIVFYCWFFERPCASIEQ